ncbi:hypothetical protein lerEdw1_021065 [Lerista edwardsae]|nr:hypothetical protein lerEdw1_021065 [Lerista edwardsae]
MSALEWFAHKSLGGGIYWIQERFYESGNRANIWLVRGSQRDVVIDTGLGLRSLPDYLHLAGLLGPDPTQGDEGQQQRRGEEDKEQGGQRAPEAVTRCGHSCALRPRGRAAPVRGGGGAQRRGRSPAPRGQLRDGHLALGQRGGPAAHPRLERQAVPSAARPAHPRPAGRT